MKVQCMEVVWRVRGRNSRGGRVAHGHRCVKTPITACEECGAELCGHHVRPHARRHELARRGRAA